MSSGQEMLLQVKGLSKSFPGVQALECVNLEVRAGEVHALMGENGAGKSTLMRILAGLEQADEGQIWIRGQVVKIADPHAALRLGIAMIHQELMPFPELTVAENVFMGVEPARGWLGWIDRGAMHRQTRALLEPLGLNLNPGQRMGTLSVAGMQTVEIARALAQQARLLIMDEPTSAVSEREVEALFSIIADLKRAGVAVIYISHKMDEIFRVADRITVLRDGKLVATRDKAAVSSSELIQLMVGRELARQRSVPAARAESGNSVNNEVPALAVRGLGRTGKFRDISFAVRRGEIVGLAGLMGAGRTEVVNAIYGMPPADCGEILLEGKGVRITCPAEALKHAIALVSEDRKQEGLVLQMSVKQNLTLSSLRRCCRGWWVDGRREESLAQEQVRRFGIKTPGTGQRVNCLSGGNQQKVVLARALLNDPQILLLDEPTRGIDVGAKAEVQALIQKLSEQGKAIVVVSSEIPELLSLCHRIVVMRQGQVTAELDAREATPQEILRYAMPD